MDPAVDIITLDDDTESDVIMLKDTRMARARPINFYDAAWVDFTKKYRQAHEVKRKKLTVPEWKDLKKVHRRACSPECLAGVVEAESRKPARSRVQSPYLTPMLYGWTRDVIGIRVRKVQYTAPCGRKYTNMTQVANYLKATSMDILLPVRIDMFSFDVRLRPEVLAHADDGTVRLVDLSWGKESVPIRVVNVVDEDGPPKMHYEPIRSIVALDNSIMRDLEKFRTCCGCEDNCRNPKKCQCQQLTKAEASRPPQPVRLGNAAYDFRTLPKHVPTGIYECNSGCRCRREFGASGQPMCNNRVAQHKMDIPLEVYKVPNVGWALRTLVDLPPGRFTFTYAGFVYSEEFATKLGSDDSYFADLDMHLGEPQAENAAVPKPTTVAVEKPNEDDAEPDVVPEGFSLEQYFSSRFKQFVIDAKRQGNVSRFANHSCEPNMYVQPVFTETHDLRLPLVAFYTCDYTPAGTPLTWNYGYSEEIKKEKFGPICLCDPCIKRKPVLKAKLQAARRIVRRSVRYFRPYPPYRLRHC